MDTVLKRRRVGFVGVIWYLAWKWKRAKEGIDVSPAFKELPPELFNKISAFFLCFIQ